MSPTPKPKRFTAQKSASSSSPRPPPPPERSTSTDATERAFFARRSRVLRVSSLPPDQANQQDLRTWFADRLRLGPDETVGIVGVCTHLPPPPTRSSGDTDPVATPGGPRSSADWWAIFKEHELARDAHRKVKASMPAEPAGGVTVALALEEDLAPLDRLVPMPLVRTLRLERQESFPTAAGRQSPDDDFRGAFRTTHARTPSLSFSSTSSAFSTHAQGSPASQTSPDLVSTSSQARTASTLSLKTKFDVGAKPFFPADRSPSISLGTGGAGSDEDVDRNSMHRRPSLQSLHGLGFSPTGDGGHGFYEGVSDFELSNLGLMGSGGGAGVSFRQGDWICPSDTCSFHNFSRNEQCMICATAKPQSSSSRPVPRAELSTPTQQRLVSTAAANSTPSLNDFSDPASHLTPQQRHAIETLASARNVAVPPHLAIRSTPPTYHTLPTRPLLNSVSLPDFQGVGSATAERARKLSTFSSPGFQLSPLSTQPPLSGQASPAGGFGSWPQEPMSTPSPDAHRTGTPGFGWPVDPQGPPIGLGLTGVRPRSLTAGGLAFDALGRSSTNGSSSSVNGHRATLSLGGAGHAPPQAAGERLAPIVNSGNTGPMTIQQGDWACGTCGFVNWRRRRVCLKCFPFAEGNELAGGNLAASVLLVTQLAQAPSMPSPAPTSEGLPASPHDNGPMQPAAGMPFPSSSSSGRSFISSGPYQPSSPSSVADYPPPRDDDRLQRPIDFDVFGLSSPIHHSPPAPTESPPSVRLAGVRRKDSATPISPIGAEVRSLTTNFASAPPLRPPPVIQSVASLRDLSRERAEHERQLNEGMLGLTIRHQGGNDDDGRADHP